MVSSTPSPKKKKRLRMLSQKLVTFHEKKLVGSIIGKGKAVPDDERVDTGCQKVDDDLRLINCHNGESIIPSKSCLIENDFITGHMHPLVSTNITHFEGRKRKVELQFQFQFKRVPDSQLFLGCELQNPLNVGICQRALLKTVIGGIQRRNEDFQYSLGSSSDSHCGPTRKNIIHDASLNRNPNMAMPFESSINSLVVTKEGEIAPTLGEALNSNNVSKGEINFNAFDTYTFAIWSAHIDLIHWKCTNLTPIQPFPLSMVIGDQPFTLSLYSVNPVDGKVEKYVEVEFSHGHKHKTMEYNVSHASNDSLIDISSESDNDDDDDIRESNKDDYGEAYMRQGCMCWSACDALEFPEF